MKHIESIMKNEKKKFNLLIFYIRKIHYSVTRLIFIIVFVANISVAKGVLYNSYIKLIAKISLYQKERYVRLNFMSNEESRL